MHQTTIKPTIVVVINVVATSFIFVPAALTGASTIIGSPTTSLHFRVPTLPVHLGNSIVFLNK
jgi:hypothetical protein